MPQLCRYSKCDWSISAYDCWHETQKSPACEVSKDLWCKTFGSRTLSVEKFFLIKYHSQICTLDVLGKKLATIYFFGIPSGYVQDVISCPKWAFPAVQQVFGRPEAQKLSISKTLFLSGTSFWLSKEHGFMTNVFWFKKIGNHLRDTNPYAFGSRQFSRTVVCSTLELCDEVGWACLKSDLDQGLSLEEISSTFKSSMLEMVNTVEGVAASILG